MTLNLVKRKYINSFILIFNFLKVNKVLSHFMKRDEALSSKYSFEMHSEVMQIKNDLGIVNRPVLDFFFNSYRKIYNFHTFFKKN